MVLYRPPPASRTVRRELLYDPPCTPSQHRRRRPEDSSRRVAGARRHNHIVTLRQPPPEYCSDGEWAMTLYVSLHEQNICIDNNERRDETSSRQVQDKCKTGSRQVQDKFKTIIRQDQTCQDMTRRGHNTNEKFVPDLHGTRRRHRHRHLVHATTDATTCQAGACLSNHKPPPHTPSMKPRPTSPSSRAGETERLYHETHRADTRRRTRETRSLTARSCPPAARLLGALRAVNLYASRRHRNDR